MKLVIVSEFGGEVFDGLVASVAREIRRRYPTVEVSFVSGFLKTYRYGGLRLSRLANYLAVYARAFFCVLRQRPAVIIADSTPPLIQHWAALLGPFIGARVYIWLMDYHPEIEARVCDRAAGLRWLARLLRRFDRRVMRRVNGVVTLDEAMADLIRDRHPTVEVKVHPPWSKQGNGCYQPVKFNNDPSVLNLVYVGNLGAAHGLESLERVLARICAERTVRLLIVGGNVDGLRRWKALVARLGIVFDSMERAPWDVLHARLCAFAPNYAIALMDDDWCGLLSPSKYTTYLQMGIPLVYLGPRRTNTDRCCRENGAGIAATRDEVVRDCEGVARAWLDAGRQASCRTATEIAHREWSSLNECSLIERMTPWLECFSTGDAAS